MRTEENRSEENRKRREQRGKRSRSVCGINGVQETGVTWCMCGGDRWCAQWCVNVLFTWTGWGPKRWDIHLLLRNPKTRALRCGHEHTCTNTCINAHVWTRRRARAHSYTCTHCEANYRMKNKTGWRGAEKWQWRFGAVQHTKTKLLWVVFFFDIWKRFVGQTWLMNT